MTLNILNTTDKFMKLMERFAYCSEKVGYHRALSMIAMQGPEIVESEASKIHKAEEQQYLGLAKGCLHDIIEHLLKMK